MSENKEKYFNVGREYGPEEFKEKGSRFISFLYPVGSKDDAEKIIQKLRKKFYDASHVCFAYRVGEGEEKYFRSSDDGEPGSTAGLPIYNEIKSKGYFNVLTVVVRYFGGTKLGTGGLARAYANSARKVIEISEKVTVFVKKDVSVSFPYSFTGEIMQVINRYSIDIISRDNRAEGIYMKLAVPEAVIEKAAQAISNKSSGKIKLFPLKC